MSMIRSSICGGALVFAFAFAQPASAAITTFAQFTAVGDASNIMWKNDGAAGSGDGGSLYTIASGSDATAGDRLVNFSFLQSALAPYFTNVSALLRLEATAADSPAVQSAFLTIQPGLSGKFSFRTTAPITVGGQTFAAGSNLLTGEFDSAAIFATPGGTSGSISSSTSSGGHITYTSSFLDFSQTAGRDQALAFTAANPATFALPGSSLATFKALATGSFSSDPAPLVTAVPEPAAWALMMTGVALLGGALRVRRRETAVAA